MHVAKLLECANHAESTHTTHKHGLVSQICSQRANHAEENIEGGQHSPEKSGNDWSGKEAKEVQAAHNLDNTAPSSRGRKATVASNDEITVKLSEQIVKVT